MEQRSSYRVYSSITEKDVEWLWYPYIPYGKITLLQGDPGDGKSTFMLNLSACLTNGSKLPDGTTIAKPENVIYQCAEDSFSDTIKPRLIQAGADCSRVAFIEDEDMSLSITDSRIENAVRDFDAKLLILDPIQAFIPQDGDMQSASKMRSLMRKLSETAEKYHCAISRRSIKFNKACHKKLGFCKYVEVLHHPILQTVVIREATEDTPNRVEWEKEDGAIVGAISTPAFTDAVYENLNWKQEYSFKFRGITKERGIGRIIIFALDEPQILIPAKEKKCLQELGVLDESQQTRYIKYRNEPDENTSDTMIAGIDYAYPEQWKKNPIGMSYAIRRQRDNVINRITEKDILQTGVFVENPMIDHIPSKDEIRSELEELLMTM